MKCALIGFAVAAALAALPVASVDAAEPAGYLAPIAGAPQTPSAGEIATGNVLRLNETKFPLYARSARVFRENILGKHPVILALFSGAGGRMILYRPGQAPTEAPSVPVAYQVMKSLGHSTMAISVVVLPYIDNPRDTSWVAPIRAYLVEMKSALEGIGAVAMPDGWRSNSRSILENNIAFMEECLAKGAIELRAVEKFARQQAPFLKHAIAWAAETQVAHWMSVLDGWKQALGGSFDRAYAATNTIYVTRQNNILFSVLAQHFGPDAVNDRLILIETISFTTTPDDLLASLVRIVADRSVGGLFFGHDRLMDYELMGGDARKAIVAEMKKRGREPFLPPAVPFGSKQWPALISGGSGAASLDELR